MAFTLKQVTGGDISENPPSATVQWRAEGAPSPLPIGDFFSYVASTAMSAIPSTFYHPRGLLYRQDLRITEHHYAKLYTISAPYAERKRESGAYQITVDQTGGSVHVTAGTRVSGWGPSGGGVGGGEDTGAAEYVSNAGLIGVDGDSILGTDIPIESTKIVVNFRHPQGVLTRNYIRQTGKLIGFPNNDSFLGYEPGEVLYMGGNFSESDAETSAQYNFAVSYNRTNLSVGGITIGEKKGWDVISPVYADEVVNDHGAKKIQYIEIVRPAGREWTDYASVFGWGGP